MRDRWLREAFAVGLSSTNTNEYQVMMVKNAIEEEEAIRLLIDYGISEDKAKIHLQVGRRHFDLFGDHVDRRSGTSKDETRRSSGRFFHRGIGANFQTTLDKAGDLSSLSQVTEPPCGSDRMGDDSPISSDILDIKISFPSKI